MLFDLVLFIFASPVLALKALLQLIRRCEFWRVAYLPSLNCGTCGDPVSLIGMWRCVCGFTYQGHVLRRCPVCHSLPRMLRCFSCGATERLPKP